MELQSKIRRLFLPPTVTSQFRVCPIPFRFDTYSGCTYGCLFCFSRSVVEFLRRSKKKTGEEAKQFYLVGNSPTGLKRWIGKSLSGDYDYNNAAMVAFKERIPVKIGTTSDPFPWVESRERITYDCLKVFDEVDYPVQISTKNPEVFLEYADEFVKSNVVLNVSCSFCDDDIARQIEVGSISPSRRFESIRKLADMGFKVIVRVQPFILPYSEQNAERFVLKIKECGAVGFQTEGLKIRVTLPKEERLIYSKIGDVLGVDILNYFRTYGVIDDGDYVYNCSDKIRMIRLFNDLAVKYGVLFYNADNFVDKCYGCGSECCGTEFLRNHKIWGGCSRSRVFGDESSKLSSEFGKCFVNFTRATRGTDKCGRTISELCDEYAQKIGLLENQFLLF